MSVLNKYISIWAGVCEQELVTTLVDCHIPIRALSYSEIRFLVVTSELPFNEYKNISRSFLNMHSLDNASLNINLNIKIKTKYRKHQVKSKHTSARNILQAFQDNNLSRVPTRFFVFFF